MPDEIQKPQDELNVTDSGHVIRQASNSAALADAQQVHASTASELNQQQVPKPAVQPMQTKHSKGWRWYFLTLAIINAIYLPLMVLTTLLGGYAFVFLLMLAPVFFPAFALGDSYRMAACTLLVVNIVSLIVFLFMYKPKDKATSGILISICSALLIFQVIIVATKVEGGIPELLRIGPVNLADREYDASNKQYLLDNAKPEITKEEAIELLRTCKLKGLYYTNQIDKSNPADGRWGELSSTGVVLTKIDGKPYRISIADRLIPELIPIARAAQKTCRGPEFWHDGNYEDYKDGKWYFQGTVVNTMESGKTKEEATGFMQSCKADYFIGYTDINLIKDSNTRGWLDKAEKSTTGIEILEGAPKSYVFASKAMTATLQDTARQFRQGCYSTRKLYIMVDNWVETEYPQGKWTRVSQ